ncbi:hypothetical protein [Pusillimonas noertemannii]|nr:hypothetical protein [Pusillimonas noertemannii]NYT68267.1 hypothetical protein [Pusillimonas noertemannii]
MTPGPKSLYKDSTPLTIPQLVQAEALGEAIYEQELSPWAISTPPLHESENETKR